MECESLGDVNEMSQSLAQSADYRLRNIRMRSVHRFEIVSGEEDQTRRLCRDRGRRVYASIKQRQLRNRTAWPFDMKNLLLAVRTRSINAHPSSLDHIQTAAGVASGEQNAPYSKIAGDTPIRELANDRLIELGKNRKSAKQCRNVSR